MPRKAKDEEIKEKNNKIDTKKSKTTTVKKAVVKKTTSKAKTADKPKASTTKATTKTTKTTSKTSKAKVDDKKTEKLATKKTAAKAKTSDKVKTSATKSTTKTTPKTSKAQVDDKKTEKPATKKTAAKAKTSDKVKTSTTKATTTKTKKSTSKVSKSSKSTVKKEKIPKKENKIEILEYYDLPYRYNQTVVKTLFQTPEILFVYWDISDKDKENYIMQYGEFFFNDTKPVLIIHNNTKNYTFEVDINDYANSWYLHITDSNCDYTIELGRRPINEYAKINNYLPISNSNEINTPNDHILFDSLNGNIYFKNIRTNKIIEKDISLSFLTKLGKLYNVKEFYETIYKDENIDFERLNLKNMPSS